MQDEEGNEKTLLSKIELFYKKKQVTIFKVRPLHFVHLKKNGFQVTRNDRHTTIAVNRRFALHNDGEGIIRTAYEAAIIDGRQHVIKLN